MASDEEVEESFTGKSAAPTGRRLMPWRRRPTRHYPAIPNPPSPSSLSRDAEPPVSVSFPGLSLGPACPRRRVFANGANCKQNGGTPPPPDRPKPITFIIVNLLAAAARFSVCPRSAVSTFLGYRKFRPRFLRPSAAASRGGRIFIDFSPVAIN